MLGAPDTLRMLPAADETVKMAAPSVAEARGDVRWIGDLLEVPAIQKMRALGRALVLFVRSPYAFGAAWARGERDIPNPGIAMATAVSILTVLTQQVRVLLHREAAHTILASVGESLGPYVMYLAFGLLAHVVLRALGSRRGVQTSAGIALLAGAGPGTLACLTIVLTVLPLKAHYGADVALDKVVSRPVLVGVALVLYGTYAWFAVAAQFALAGAHRVARWKGMLAGTVAIAIFGALCGAAEHSEVLHRLTYVFGPHLSVTVVRHHLDTSFVW